MEYVEPNNYTSYNFSNIESFMREFGQYFDDSNPDNHYINSIVRYHIWNNDKIIKDLGFILPCTLSDVSMSTLRNMVESPSRGKVPSPTCIRVFHDKNSDGYWWMEPGWLCEERTMQSGRLYKIYYGPDGKKYQTKSQVKIVCKNAGVDVNGPK